MAVTRLDSSVPELHQLLRLAVPVVFTYTLQTSLTLVMLFCAGHKMNSIDLGAAALGHLYCSVTGLTVGLGMSTAMDTLSSQAFGQDPKSPLVGIILQRAILIMSCLSVPISVLWWNAEAILLSFGQHPEITALTKVFCRWMIPGLLPYLVFECFKKYLQTQGAVWETMYALLCGSALNAFLHYLLVYSWEWGFVALPISLSLSHLSLPLFLLFFVRLSGSHKNTWAGWSPQALTEWRPFLKLGVPGVLMLCSEWWASEVLVLAAGFIGDNELAAQTIVTTTNTIIFMIPFGIGVAVNTRVGNLLGAGQPERARSAAFLAIAINFCSSFVVFFLLIFYRQEWGYLFSNDQEVVDLVSSILGIYALAQTFDGLQGVEAGIIRSLGKQHMGSIMNFFSYYLLGTPFGLFLAFQKDEGLEGLWWGMCASFASCSLLYTFVILRVDWKKEAVIAKERIKEDMDKLGVSSELGRLRHSKF